MNYILFNNGIFISDGTNVRRLQESDQDILASINKAKVCVVDVDLLIAAAVEYPVEKKDSILVRKFKELYGHEAYIIQDERIDNNLFQVMGIKEQKVREVYALIAPQKVESFIPYGMAVRNTLINKRIDLNKTIVFVDDCGQESLLTVFDGLKFSRTRVIPHHGEDILPEIKRSQIDFFKKTEEFRKNTDFVIIVNNQAIAGEIARNNENIAVDYLNVAYPAMEGLKEADNSIKYSLPEENLKKRKENESKKKIKSMVISLGIVAAGLFYFMYYRVQGTVLEHQYALESQIQGSLNARLNTLDQEIYREDLKIRLSLNYGVTYLSMLEIIPASYTVNSFRFYKNGKWNIEMALFNDNDGISDPIPRSRILKDAEIKDIFVNNQPGKHLKIVL